MSKITITRTIGFIFLLSLMNPIAVMANVLDEISLKDESTNINVSAETSSPDTSIEDNLNDSEEKYDQIITAYDQVKFVDDNDFLLGATTSGDGTLSYVSQDPKVVSVDNNGYVKIVGVGTTTITITACEIYMLRNEIVLLFPLGKSE